MMSLPKKKRYTQKTVQDLDLKKTVLIGLEEKGPAKKNEKEC